MIQLESYPQGPRVQKVHESEKSSSKDGVCGLWTHLLSVTSSLRDLPKEDCAPRHQHENNWFSWEESQRPVTQLPDHILKVCCKIPLLKRRQEQEIATTTPFFINTIIECHEQRRQTFTKQAYKEKKAFILISENAVGFNWDKVPGSHLNDPPAIALQSWHLLMSILRIPFICSCLPNRRMLTGKIHSSLMIRNSWVLPKPMHLQPRMPLGTLACFLPAHGFLTKMPVQSNLGLPFLQTDRLPERHLLALFLVIAPSDSCCLDCSRAYTVSWLISFHPWLKASVWWSGTKCQTLSRHWGCSCEHNKALTWRSGHSQTRYTFLIYHLMSSSYKNSKSSSKTLDYPPQFIPWPLSLGRKIQFILLSPCFPGLFHACNISALQCSE